MAVGEFLSMFLGSTPPTKSFLSSSASLPKLAEPQDCGEHFYRFNISIPFYFLFIREKSKRVNVFKL